MRYMAVVQYVGTNYFGWQRQPFEISVQQVIEDKLSTIFNTDIKIHASGRTDAKVHAYGQVFHFDAPPFPVRKLQYALNKMLPADIEILKVNKVKDDFHARYSAKSKTYEYLICLEAKDPFLSGRVLFYPLPLDEKKLKKDAKLFVGTHNFQNFTSKKEDDANFVRTISLVKIQRHQQLLKIVFVGDGFMRGQIRMMIGALLAQNTGKEKPNFISENLNTTERKIINHKVIGDGLYLRKVTY
ncbi:MAG: tRNA pseudouridine synthase A [Tenericutes bacterium ADurb.Bin239]|nr:MAG: tRNA pseudouridine synthase A [Tenericutes bacterium ADurb.Bin239]